MRVPGPAEQAAEQADEQADEEVVVALVRQQEDEHDVDVEVLARLLRRQGWSAGRVAAATRQAVTHGALYEDCRLALHAVR